MSFCSNCGNQVNESIKFCPKCGTALGGLTPVNNDLPVQNNIRNIKEEASKLFNYFNAKSDLFDEALRIEKQLSDQSYPKRTWLVPMLFLGFPAILLDSNEVGSIVAGIVLELLLIGLLIFLVRRRKKKIDELDERRFNLKNRQDEIFQILDDYYDAYGNCPIAPEYVWPDDLAVITDYILSGRADSFKEAINLYHQQQEIDKMQNKMDSAVYNSQMANAKAGLAAAISVYDHLTR